MWIHNRPEFAVALTPHIHRAGGRVVLHLHNSHLVDGRERLIASFVWINWSLSVSFCGKEAQEQLPQAGDSRAL